MVLTSPSAFVWIFTMVPLFTNRLAISTDCVRNRRGCRGYRARTMWALRLEVGDRVLHEVCRVLRDLLEL